MKHNLLLVLIVCVIALLFGAVTVTAQGPSPNGVAGALGTAFTYQGQLSKNGVPVNGDVSITFRLYSVASGGSPLGSNTQIVIATGFAKLWSIVDNNQVPANHQYFVDGDLGTMQVF